MTACSRLRARHIDFEGARPGALGSGGTFDLGYVDPDINQKGLRFNPVMGDQPEIFVADDSKYKGAKPDHMKQLAVIERLENGAWPIARKPLTPWRQKALKELGETIRKFHRGNLAGSEYEQCYNTHKVT